jgi:hypothetical protein
MAVLHGDPHGVVMHGYVEDLGQLAHFLLGLDCAFVVRHPPELRGKLRKLAVRAAAMVELAE